MCVSVFVALECALWQTLKIMSTDHLCRGYLGVYEATRTHRLPFVARGSLLVGGAHDTSGRVTVVMRAYDVAIEVVLDASRDLLHALDSQCHPRCERAQAPLAPRFREPVVRVAYANNAGIEFDILRVFVSHLDASLIVEGASTHIRYLFPQRWFADETRRAWLRLTPAQRLLYVPPLTCVDDTLGRDLMAGMLAAARPSCADQERAVYLRRIATHAFGLEHAPIIHVSSTTT